MRFDIFYHYGVYDCNVKKCQISSLNSRLISITPLYNHYEKTPMVTKIAVEIQKLPNYFENHKVKCND